MVRERALKVVLVIVGLLSMAWLYPILMMHPKPAEGMLGIMRTRDTGMTQGYWHSA